LSSSPAAPIEFKQEFASSTAALAASHDETVRNILSRLDSLQSKVAGTEEVRFAPETTASQPRSKPPASTTPAKPAAAASSPTELHARVSQLENIHQDHLQRLGAQLNAVESSLMDRGAENHTINEISAKFDRIEDHVRNAPDARTINEIAAKFDRIEGHVRNTAQLHDRIRSLESEVASLRSATIPHPEQERLLNKINERLDHWENSRAAAGKPTSTTLGARADTPVAGDRAEYLAARIDKLKELRSKYEG
jgi:vacuolar-type H+-ATPase subunit I/STV1